MASDVHLPGKEFGTLSGCPFCRAARDIFALPAVGSRFRILSGLQTGRIGTVVDGSKFVPRHEFLAQMDDESSRFQRRVLPGELIELLPAAGPPDWAPPIELRIAAGLDEVVVKFCEAGNCEGTWSIGWPAFFGVLDFIWRNRLPLTEDEVWAVLHAHGVPESNKRELLDFFQKGLDLLVYAVGRKPIKTRRVHPLSVSEHWRGHH